MTKREFLKLELLKSLDQYLKPDGFKLNKRLAEFTKNKFDGWHKFQVIFLMRNQDWELNPSLLIRKNIVEDIFHSTSGFEVKYQKKTPTIGLDISTLINDDNCEFFLRNEEEIDLVAKRIFEKFNEFGQPFFNKFNSIDSIEKTVNANLNDNTLTGPVFKGSKGVILAKLTGNPLLNKLISNYTKYYENFENGFYLPEFKCLIERLSSI